MKLPAQIGMLLEHLEDQRTFIRDTLRQLNDQMAVVERSIHGLCLAIKHNQEDNGDAPTYDCSAALVDAGLRQ